MHNHINTPHTQSQLYFIIFIQRYPCELSTYFSLWKWKFMIYLNAGTVAFRGESYCFHDNMSISIECEIDAIS